LPMLSGMTSHSPAMNWKSFTGFFEGDGAVSVRLGRTRGSRVLQICIVIGQKWKPKLEQLNRFLRTKGIDPGKVYPQKYGYTLRVFKISAVKMILANMLPHSFLKREQIRAALNYLDGKTNGNRLLSMFDREFEREKRRGRPPKVSIPLPKRNTKGRKSGERQHSQGS